MSDPDYREYEESLKESRQERKRRANVDRSKYKKTDADKRKKAKGQETMPEHLTRGRVISIQSQEITVDVDGTEWTCVLRGVLKKERTRDKNLVAVGDWVGFEPIGDQEGAVAFVEPRKSILSRADNLSRNRQQIIATNVDQVLITVSVVVPPLKPALIDRYIIAAKQGGMDPIVVINKIDLLETDDMMAEVDAIVLDEVVSTLKDLEIPVVEVSVDQGVGIDELKQLMAGRTSVFSGQSGVGKSSLINAVTGLDLAVGDTVQRTRKGAHTTTSAHLISLDCGGWCVDTPGIKSFGVWKLELSELAEHFPEIAAKGAECHFPDCTHTHEEVCAVKDAVERGEISEMRYDSYLILRDEVQQVHRRR